MSKLLYNRWAKQFFVTMPKRIIEVKNWKAGMPIKWQMNEMGQLILMKVEK